MRVAMIGAYPVDARVVPGGVAAVAHYLVKGLGQLPDLDLHVVCCDPAVRQDFTESRDGATVHFLSCPDRLNHLTNWFVARRRIARLLNRLQPDLVHAQGLGLATAAAADTQQPWAVTLHGVIWKESGLTHASPARWLRGRFFARQAYRQLLGVPNIFVISDYAAAMLPPDRPYRTFRINNPVGEEIFRLRNRPTSPHILVVGGLRHRKDPLTAIQVFERVVTAVPEATMDLLGPDSNTPLDQAVADDVASRGLDDKVRLLGLVPDKKLWEEYERAAVLLLTSKEETAPVALGEACAVGLPAVGTDAGGIPTMIHDGETGFVRPVGDTAGLAERIVAILTDAPLRDRLAARAREVGHQEYALDRITEQTLAAYRTIVAGDAITY